MGSVKSEKSKKLSVEKAGEVQNEKYDVRRVVLRGRKFDERSYFKDADKTGDTDHGVFVSGDFI